jgi:hypothetical protein
MDTDYLEAGPAIKNRFHPAPFSAFDWVPSFVFDAFIRVDRCNPWLIPSELIRIGNYLRRGKARSVRWVLI